MTAESATGGRSAADRYLYGTVAAGIVIVVVAAVAAGPDLISSDALLILAALAVTAPTPLLTRTRGDTVALTIDELFLVPAFVLLTPPTAIVVTAVGIAAGLLAGTRWPAPWVRQRFFSPRRIAFNAAQTAVAVAVGALLVWIVDPAGLGAHVMTAAAAAAVFSLASGALVAGMIVRVADQRFVKVMTGDYPGFLVVLFVTVGAGSLLALGAASLPFNAVWIGLAVVLVFAASALTNRATQQAERMAGLLEAASRISGAGTDLAAVEAALEESARELLDCHVAAIRERPAGPGELAVEVVAGTWLHVADPKSSYTRTFEINDRTLLRALRAIAGPALEHARAMQDLRNADDLKAAVLASVSHDVRNPLSAATAISELLATFPDLPEEKRQDLLERLRTSVGRVTRLVDGLLDLERYELGRLPEPADAVVRDVVARVVETVRGEGAAAVVAEGSDVRAAIDAPALERVVENLVSNALKHSPVDVPVMVTYGAAGALAHLTVADAGPGVPPERRLEIFEPFRHGTKVGSVGLGLWVARRFVELRDGRIWVDDSEHGGAAFHVELPLANGRAASGRSGPADG